MKWRVLSLFVVEVDADDSVTAEAKAKTLIPTLSQIQQVGRVVRMQVAVETTEYDES